MFTAYDKCADGWAAVVKVGVAPYKSNGRYGFAIWNPNSAKVPQAPVAVDKSYAEGTAICMQAGAGEYRSGEWGWFGPWSCGAA